MTSSALDTAASTSAATAPIFMLRSAENAELQPIGAASLLALRIVPSTVIDLVFRVWGARLNPEELTVATGITPARSFHVGEMRGAAANRVAGWEWRSAEGEDDEALMQALLRDLAPHVDLFRLCHEEGATLSLTVVGVIRGDLVESWEEAERRKIRAENGDRFRRFLDADRVGVSLSEAAIQFLAAVGATYETHIDLELREPTD